MDSNGNGGCGGVDPRTKHSRVNSNIIDRMERRIGKYFEGNQGLGASEKSCGTAVRVDLKLGCFTLIIDIRIFLRIQ